MQIPPWDDRYAYMSRGNTIKKFKLSGNSDDKGDVVFTVDGENIYLGNCLLLDEETLIAGINIRTDEVDDRGVTVYGKFGILIDSRDNGYYLLDDAYMGAMALDPRTGELLRTASLGDRKYEIRKFEIVKEN